MNFGIPKTAPDEKLEFVEHVLGVLIESRFGPGHGYTALGETPVTTGHSQLFANVRLLTEAEIEAHLEFGGSRHRPFSGAVLRELPLGSANGLRLQNIPGFSPMVVWAKARQALDALHRWITPTAIQRAQNDLTSLPRGSPTFSGTLFSASSFANLANFAREKYFTQRPQRTQRRRKQFLGRATDTSETDIDL